MTLFPQRYKLDSKGKTRTWRLETDEAGSYRSIAGVLGGNLVTSEWTACEPKNVGRSNQTTAEEQCELEVVALYTKKRDKHYVDSLGAINEERKYFEVMLAATYNEKTKPLLFVGRDDTVWSQPKLDGLRGPTTRDGSFSRAGNEFVAARFLSEALAPVFAVHPDLVFDGEIYNHEYREDFNEIVSAVKNGGNAEQLARARALAQLHVYDLYDPARPNEYFHERDLRIRILLERFSVDPNIIVRVGARPVESFVELDELYDGYLEAGYEGQMIRFDRPYEHKRTKALLKRKEMMDAEFKIVEIQEGKGNWSGYAKRIIVRLPDGRTNSGGMMGTQAYLRGVLAERDRYVGGTATIKFQGYTPDGKLRFPRSSRLYRGARDD